MSNYDQFGRVVSTDQGTSIPAAAPGAGLAPGTLFVIKVPLTAGAGTALDTSVTAPQKLRLVDVKVNTTSTVTSAVTQVFTAASGGGTAASSSIASAAAGVARDALTTATQVFAAGSTMFVRQSGGATLAGGEVYLYCVAEQ